MAKKKKGKKRKTRRGEHHRRGNVTFGGALAAGGEVSSVIGIVVAWIMAVGLVLGGLYFGGMGIVGHTPLFDSGSCQASGVDNCILNKPPNCGIGCYAENDMCVIDDPCAGATKESCPNVSGGNSGKCVWNPSEQLTGGTRAFYIVAGLGMIAFAVGIVLFAYWWNRKVHQDKNMAAFAGGLTAMNVMGNAFRG